MQLDIHAVKVEPYLEAKRQPVLAWEGMKPGHTYYVLTEPKTGEFVLATTNSQVARVPMFGLSTQKQHDLSSGSCLMLIAMETVLNLIEGIGPLQHVPTKAVILVGNSCHDLGDSYRGYLGLVLEVPK